MIICGPNILTASDDNDSGRTDLAGLRLTNYNFAAHYPPHDGEERSRRDGRIHDYHTSHANPVLALEDDGYVEIDNEGMRVVRGHCWLFEQGTEKRLLERGYSDAPSPNPGLQGRDLVED
jgi:hypothetical protein